MPVSRLPLEHILWRSQNIHGLYQLVRAVQSTQDGNLGRLRKLKLLTLNLEKNVKSEKRFHGQKFYKGFLERGNYMKEVSSTRSRSVIAGLTTRLTMRMNLMSSGQPVHFWSVNVSYPASKFLTSAVSNTPVLCQPSGRQERFVDS
ncbi:hypothetical protein RRG08_043379 [Elysia crispata]|uniref:Uncharacterized protein n=1 Tax=Elysia crispata TaxID=231223 RepID=A0AAE1AUV3_9GAST|nr:hypothetical protein RRG08_043379 [Elysia crispata]